MAMSIAMKYTAVYVCDGSWSPVMRHPSRFRVSPMSHSARNHGDRPSADLRLKLRTSWGNCATSQDPMEARPR